MMLQGALWTSYHFAKQQHILASYQERAPRNVCVHISGKGTLNRVLEDNVRLQCQKIFVPPSWLISLDAHTELIPTP